MIPPMESWRRWLSSVLPTSHGMASAAEAVRRASDGRRYTNEALEEARAKHAAAEEAERQEFASLVADFRKGTGPVVIEREREAVK